jgi:hypothetical protein
VTDPLNLAGLQADEAKLAAALQADRNLLNTWLPRGFYVDAKGELQKPKYIPYVPKKKQWAFLMYNGRECLLGGEPGGGKGQPLDGTVMTPFGPTTMGALKVGSCVCNPDGSYSRVIHITELGERQLYKVRFAGNLEAEVTEDHLWLSWPSSSPRKTDR